MKRRIERELRREEKWRRLEERLQTMEAPQRPGHPASNAVLAASGQPVSASRKLARQHATADADACAIVSLQLQRGLAAFVGAESAQTQLDLERLSRSWSLMPGQAQASPSVV